jgi:hypothetical protein
MVVKISFSIRDCANVIHKADFKGDVKLLSRLKTTLPRQDFLESFDNLKPGIARHRSETWLGVISLEGKYVIKNS